MALSKTYTVCTIKGCFDKNGEVRKHFARGMCSKHYNQWRKDVLDVDEQEHKQHVGYWMMSVCCGKETLEGPEHDHGKQYCGKCHNPCYWSYESL